MGRSYIASSRPSGLHETVKKEERGSDELFVVLAEELGSVSIAYMAAHKHLHLFPRSTCLHSLPQCLKVRRVCPFFSGGHSGKDGTLL